MNLQDKNLSDLADRAARGEPGAMAEWCRAMEPELAPIVRRALRQGARHAPSAGPMAEGIVAAARRLAESDPALAAAGREGLVRPVARQLAESMLLRRARPEPWAPGGWHQGALETVRM